jgi:hypothetical protein
MVVEGCGSPLASIGDGVKGAGSPRQFQELLGDAVHIDRKRGAAETNKRNAELFFVQFGIPRSSLPTDNTSEA